MNAATIARLNITLDNVEPKVLRRIEVPLSIRLDRLHMTLQATLGWTNSHLYEIRVGGRWTGQVAFQSSQRPSPPTTGSGTHRE